MLVIHALLRKFTKKVISVWKLKVMLRGYCWRHLLTIGTLRNYDGNGNAKKAIDLMNKTTTLHVHHAFL